MAALIDDLVAWTKQEREINQTILDRLESGALINKSRSGLGSALVDTTAADIERYKRLIGDADALIARHPDAG